MIGESAGHPLDLSETIVAQATVSGRSALAIVRLSGPDAHAIAKRAVDRWPNHATERGPRRVRDADGTELDRVDRHSLRRACLVHRRGRGRDHHAWRTGRSDDGDRRADRSGARLARARRVLAASGAQRKARHSAGRGDGRPDRRELARGAGRGAAPARRRVEPAHSRAARRNHRTRGADRVRHRLSRGRRRADCAGANRTGRRRA